MIENPFEFNEANRSFLRAKGRDGCESRALLVVPTSLVLNWRDDSARFAPSLRVVALYGAARAQRFDEIAEHDVVITKNALLVRDAVLLERSWHGRYSAKAQALDNPQAKAAQSAMALRPSHRL